MKFSLLCFGFIRSYNEMLVVYSERTGFYFYSALFLWQVRNTVQTVPDSFILSFSIYCIIHLCVGGYCFCSVTRVSIATSTEITLSFLSAFICSNTNRRFNYTTEAELSSKGNFIAILSQFYYFQGFAKVYSCLIGNSM